MGDTELTISGMMGSCASIRHNNRDFVAKNVDPDRVQRNEIYVKDDIEQVYHELFDAALKEYNAGKKKTRDKISDYYQHIAKGSREKSFYEAIFMVGNNRSCPVGSELGETAAEILREFVSGFQKRNPHLRVFNAVLHMDEDTPHVHIDFIPFATEQTRGLSTRVSLKRALEQQGFSGTGRERTEWSCWMQSEKQILADLMKEKEIEVRELGGGRKHMDLPAYRQAAQQLEAAQAELGKTQKALEEAQGELKKIQKALEEEREKADRVLKGKKSVKKVEGKKIMGNMMCSQTELDELLNTARALVIGEVDAKADAEKSRDALAQMTKKHRYLEKLLIEFDRAVRSNPQDALQYVRQLKTHAEKEKLVNYPPLSLEERLKEGSDPRLHAQRRQVNRQQKSRNDDGAR